MKRLLVVALATLLPVLMAVAGRGAEGAAPARPNIIFILADDFGLDDVGCYGSDRFKTPALDALAAGGLRFDNCYCTPLCGPTRCEFITGRYGFRTGGLTNGSAGRPTPADEPSVARVLQQAGYKTAQAGKWRQMGATPKDWGFDEYITDPTPGGYYWQNSYTKNGEVVKLDKQVYYPDVTHAFAIDFIQRHRDEPFFLYYPSHLVHSPILRTPDTKSDAGAKGNLYADNVAYLDKEVGDLMAHLDRLGLREKTLVIFVGDNGTAGGSGTIHGRRLTGGSGTIHGRGLSGSKGSMLDCGAHVPMIANWKGVTPQGKVVKDLVDFSDMLATFADLAGAKLPQGVTFDGRSFAPQLRGQPGNPREWIFVQLGSAWYVRDMDWKLNQQGALFNMKDAPFVEKPVAAGEGDAAAARQRLQAVLEKLNPAAGKTESPRAAGGKGGKQKGGKQKGGKRAKAAAPAP